jgi:ribonuclease I
MFGYLSELIYGYLGRNRYYLLSLIKEDNNNYSIHGLWPQYTNKSYPKYCKKVEFTLDKIKSLLPKLNKLWYSKFTKNEDFWKHEYEKHGSCMFRDMTEMEYFEKTLELFDIAKKNDIIFKYINKNKNKIGFDDKKILIPLDLDFNFILS